MLTSCRRSFDGWVEKEQLVVKNELVAAIDGRPRSPQHSRQRSRENPELSKTLQARMREPAVIRR